MASVFPHVDYTTIEPTALTGTSKTLCYTVGDQGDAWSDVTGVWIVGAGAAQIHVKLSAAGTERLFNDDVTVAAGYPHTVEGLPLHMEPGGTISVSGESGQFVWITIIKGQRTGEAAQKDR